MRFLARDKSESRNTHTPSGVIYFHLVTPYIATEKKDGFPGEMMPSDKIYFIVIPHLNTIAAS